jgi:hypothetical protein
VRVGDRRVAMAERAELEIARLLAPADGGDRVLVECPVRMAVELEVEVMLGKPDVPAPRDRDVLVAGDVGVLLP